MSHNMDEYYPRPLPSHFDEREFICKCPRYCYHEAPEIYPALASFLVALRAIFGTAIIVTSGRRCMKWNTECGGVRNSKHSTPTLMASDLTTPTPRNKASVEFLHMCAQLVQVCFYRSQVVEFYISRVMEKNGQYYFHIEWEKGELDASRRFIYVPETDRS